jgi:uncharacterized protein YfcZ (UPF0381/DUF406 family)
MEGDVKVERGFVLSNGGQLSAYSEFFADRAKAEEQAKTSG